MPTIKISGTKDIAAAIDYAEGKDKLGKDYQTKKFLSKHNIDSKIINNLKDRAVIKSSNNMLFNDGNPAKNEMKRILDFRHNKKGSLEAHRFIQSFAPNEFNINNIDDWKKVNEMGLELSKRIAPDNPALIYTHIDGKGSHGGQGHKIHNHIILNSYNLRTGKKYSHRNDFHRVAKINDQLARKHGITPLSDIKHSQKEKYTMSERNILHKNKYSWKEDMRSRIISAVNSVIDDEKVTNTFANFQNKLNDKNVYFNKRGNSSTFSFIDKNHHQQKSRCTKLGSMYTRENIKEALSSGRKLRRSKTRDARHDFKSINKFRNSAIKSTQGRTGHQLRFERFSQQTKHYSDSAKRNYKSAIRYYPFQGHSYQGIERSVHQRVSKLSEQSEENEEEIQETDNTIESEDIILNKIAEVLSRDSQRRSELIANLQAEYTRLEIKRQEEDDQRRKKNERRQIGPKGPNMR